MAPHAHSIPNYEEEFLLAEAIEDYYAGKFMPTTVTYYAVYEIDGQAVEGTAELMGSAGYLFRADRDGTVLPVALHDPRLCLAGRTDLADAQRAADAARGGLAAMVCGYGQ